MGKAKTLDKIPNFQNVKTPWERRKREGGLKNLEERGICSDKNKSQVIFPLPLSLWFLGAQFARPPQRVILLPRASSSLHGGGDYANPAPAREKVG